MTTDVHELRAHVMKLHHETEANPTTAQAAFGVACVALKDGLRCNLTTAAALLDCWLTEHRLRSEKDGKT